jgi:hypothetical protein
VSLILDLVHRVSRAAAAGRRDTRRMERARRTGRIADDLGRESARRTLEGNMTAAGDPSGAEAGTW